MLISIYLGVLLLFFISGIPIAFGVGLTCMIAMLFQTGALDYPMMAQRMLYGINNFTLLAVPLFMLAGRLMNVGGVTRRIFRLANNLVGYFPGGLGHVNVVASMLFAGMSGSAVADAAGLGTIEIEAMYESGYDLDFSTAITAASCTIGPIIPPSVAMVIYGALSGASIIRLFIGGLIPGLMMGFSLMAMVYIISRRRGYSSGSIAPWPEILASFREAILPVFTPVIIIGGIYLGIFTPTEAAAVAVVYTFAVGCLVHRELHLSDLPQIFYGVMRDTAVIALIIATSSLYGWLLIRTRIPVHIAEGIMSLTSKPILILLLLNGFFLLIGCFMETIAALTILTPIMIPLAQRVGIDPVHLGVIMTLNLTIGLLTPPMGAVLFVLNRVTNMPLGHMARIVLPFMVPLFSVLLLLSIFPSLVTFLPNVMMD